MSSPIESLTDAILQRASLDADFRKKLIASPEAAIEDAFRVKLPKNFRLKFVERDTKYDSVHVLPDLHSEGDELSPEDLESVAGGADRDPTWDD
jgi:hypothetical protein